LYASVLAPGAGGGGAAWVAWNYQNADVYADGQSATSSDSGSTWTAEATYDRYFVLYYGSIAGLPAFLDDTTGAITLAVNAAGSSKYNQRIGYMIDRTHIQLATGIRNIYATYSFTADASSTVETTLTLGFRPMLVFASLYSGTAGRGSMGLYMSGGASVSLENKPGGVQANGATGYYGNYTTGLARFSTQNLATDGDFIVVALTVTGTTANTLSITRTVTETGTASQSCVVYLNIIGW
jgi:hypothetical protein